MDQCTLSAGRGAPKKCDYSAPETFSRMARKYLMRSNEFTLPSAKCANHYSLGRNFSAMAAAFVPTESTRNYRPRKRAARRCSGAGGPPTSNTQVS
jgi:hypothetical protein